MICRIKTIEDVLYKEVGIETRKDRREWSFSFLGFIIVFAVIAIVIFRIFRELNNIKL